MMLILMRLKIMMLLAIGMLPDTWGNFNSIVVRMTIRMDMIPIMVSSFRRLLASGESSFFIVIQFLL